jgi:hypothetical protein
MKHLRLILPLSLVAFIATFSIATAESYDSDTATIKKGCAHNGCTHSAEVLLDKKTYTVPICFGDGADWSSVKDHYELSDAAASAIKSGKASISIGSDGTVTTKKK